MKLVRDIRTDRFTLGYIDLPNSQRIYTLERPWIPAFRNTSLVRAGSPWSEEPPCGRKGVSCVPPGLYELKRHSSEMHPNSVALVNPELWVYHQELNVPVDQRGIARTAVLIHPANQVEELRGCIAPGMRRDEKQGIVTQSRLAYHLMRHPEWPQLLEIVDGT